MNFFDADLLEVLQSLSKDDPSRLLDRKEVFRIISNFQRDMYEDPTGHDYMISELMSRELMSTESAEVVMENFTSQLIWEATNMFRGVVIHIEDEELVKMLLRTKMDALMGDVTFPFPICEFAFPEGIPLGVGDYQVSGALICDFKRFNLADDWKSIGDLSFIKHPSEGFSCMTRLKGMNNKLDEQGLSWIRFSPDQPLSKVPLKGQVSAVDSKAMHKMVYLIFALGLYLQTEEGQQALLPRIHHKGRADMAKSLKKMHNKRKHVTIRNLLSEKFSSSIDKGGSHASPQTHWRKMHLRTLRDEKFKRNPDGSIRAVWVKASIVNPSEEETRTERKV